MEEGKDCDGEIYSQIRYKFFSNSVKYTFKGPSKQKKAVIEETNQPINAGIRGAFYTKHMMACHRWPQYHAATV